MQVALDQVYELLRSERPLEPARRLLGAFVDDFHANGAGTTAGLLRASLGLKKAADALGVPALPPAYDEQTLVAIDALPPLLDSEGPRGEANRTAVDLLRLAITIRREKSWSQADRAKALVLLCQKLASASGEKSLGGAEELAVIRSMLDDLAMRLQPGTTINQAPAFDLEKLRDIVASEVRAGVAAGGKDRWSAEPLSKMADAFLADEAKKDVGSKHGKDVPRRLDAFVSFVGKDKPVRDIVRKDIEDYRDALDQLPPRFMKIFRTQDVRIALEKNAESKVQLNAMKATNIDPKWLGPVHRLCKWLAEKDKIEKDVSAGVLSRNKDDEAANTKRLSFKPDQISRIFAVTSAASPKTATYWLPLLMLATGARPNELAQLRTDDLDPRFNDQPHLNVLCLIDDDDDAAPERDETEEKKKSQRVKTAAGRRKIPLHPILVRAGFIQFVQDRDAGKPKQLFRDVRPDANGFWSSAITKRTQSDHS